MHTGKISIVLPAYNEAQHILANLRETVRALRSFEAEFEIIVVDDGSHDGTFFEALRLAADRRGTVSILGYGRNEGKGYALSVGARHARGDYIVFLDADMDLHPEQLPGFFEIMHREHADVVVGSKWHPRSRVTYPLHRRVFSIGYFTLVKLLFCLPTRDTQTGMKLFRPYVLRDVLPHVRERRFTFDLEMLALAHRRGYRIREAPVTLDFRRSLGRVRGRDVWRMFFETLRIFWRLRVRRAYDAPKPSIESVNASKIA